MSAKRLRYSSPSSGKNMRWCI